MTVSPHIRQKLYQLTGNNYSNEEIELLQKECLTSDLSFYEYVQSKNDTESDKLINFYNSLPDVDFFDIHNEKTKEVLIKLCLSKIAGLNAYVRRVKYGTPEQVSISSVKDTFFKVMPKIKNNNLFWILFGIFYIYYEVTSFSLKQFLEIITEERLKVSLLDRSKLCSILFSLMYLRVEEQTGKIETSEDLKKYLEEKAFEYYKDPKKNIFRTTETLYGLILKVKEKNDENLLGIYRGFKINKSDKQSIIFDKEKKRQIAGRGLSYTVDKEVAVRFAARKTDYARFLYTVYQFDEKNWDVPNFDDSPTDPSIVEQAHDTLVQNGFTRDFYTDKKVRDNFYHSAFGKSFVARYKKHFSDKPDLFDRIIKNEKQFNNSNLHAYVCSCGVTLEDIIFFSTYDGELEIVCNPDNVLMTGYQSVTFEQFLHLLKSGKELT